MLIELLFLFAYAFLSNFDIILAALEWLNSGRLHNIMVGYLLYILVHVLVD